jgi:hypothetical protein
MNYLTKDGEIDIEIVKADAMKLYQIIGGDIELRFEQIMRKVHCELMLKKLSQQVIIDRNRDASLLRAFRVHLRKRALRAQLHDGIGVITKGDSVVAHFWKGTRAVKCSKDVWILPDEKFNTFYVHQNGNTFDFLDLIREPELLSV